MREPAFWWRQPGFASALLAPAAAIYGAVASSRMMREGKRCSVPVICVGNFTLGGSGKTPAVVSIAKMLQDAGERVFCLSRGYGGSASGPKLVDAHADTAAAVGDETLLLARVASTIVSRERVSGAEFARTQGATVVLMDDGLQNGSIKKDFTLAVVDGRRGLGCGKVFPAGPLRAPLAAQWTRCDALLVVGEASGCGDVVAAAKMQGKSVFNARLVPEPAAVTALSGKHVLAFAGIGDPDKFFSTLVAAGVDAQRRAPFPDHHRFTTEEAAHLVMQADEAGLEIVTTEKDHARLMHDAGLAALCQRAHVLPVTLEFEKPEEIKALLVAALSRRTARGTAA